MARQVQVAQATIGGRVAGGSGGLVELDGSGAIRCTKTAVPQNVRDDQTRLGRYPARSLEEVPSRLDVVSSDDSALQVQLAEPIGGFGLTLSECLCEVTDGPLAVCFAVITGEQGMLEFEEPAWGHQIQRYVVLVGGSTHIAGGKAQIAQANGGFPIAACEGHSIKLMGRTFVSSLDLAGEHCSSDAHQSLLRSAIR